MDLRQLRYLVALTEEGTFTRASRRLHVAQPHVSRQIAALERVTGTPLVIRGRRGVTLTPAGQALAGYAREILSRVEAAQRVTSDIGSGAGGQIRMGAVSSGFSFVVPTMLRAMSRQMPAILPLVYPMEPIAQLDALRDQHIDVGILRYNPNHDGITLEEILKEPMWVMLPASHRLAEEDEVVLADLEEDDFVLFPRHVAPWGYDFIVSACLRAGFSPRIVAEAPNDHVKASLVAGGLGVSLVMWSAQHLMLPGVAYRPIANPPCLPMYLAWREDNCAAVLKQFRDLCSATITLNDATGAR